MVEHKISFPDSASDVIISFVYRRLSCKIAMGTEVWKFGDERKISGMRFFDKFIVNNKSMNDRTSSNVKKQPYIQHFRDHRMSEYKYGKFRGRGKFKSRIPFFGVTLLPLLDFLLDSGGSSVLRRLSGFSERRSFFCFSTAFFLLTIKSANSTAR